jgi:aryl-alcohol dehydrogenase-like predicted oxidoreductase
MIDPIDLGTQGLRASRIALGCMGMSEFYVGSTERESQATIEAAVSHGVTMFDTADMYGPFTNEELVGRCLKPHRAQVILATKFGYVRRTDGTRLGLNGRPEYVRRACDESLRRLGTDYLDLYYLHRVDRNVPIEDTVGAMAGLVRAGKVRYLGLSEVAESTLRRAHAVHPISAVQTEYSLISRDPEFDLFQLLKSLGIGFVAYAPLGRGLLTGRFQSVGDIAPSDYRQTSPRFSSENLTYNSLLVTELQRMAREIGATAAQLALAWVRHKLGDGGVILVGTANRSRLLENISALQLKLEAPHVVELDEVFNRGVIRGARYPDMSRVDA